MRFLGLPIVAVVAIVAALPAWAAEPSGPCVHGPSQVAIAGINIDELKCELAVTRMERANGQERIEKLLAAVNLIASDLAVAREAAAKRETDLALWFKGQFGDKAAK